MFKRSKQKHVTKIVMKFKTSVYFWDSKPKITRAWVWIGRYFCLMFNPLLILTKYSKKNQQPQKEKQFQQIWSKSPLKDETRALNLDSLTA